MRLHFVFLHVLGTCNSVPFYYEMDIYDSKKWQRKRKAILARDKYICQVSKRYGKIIQADVVHHIFPVEYCPQYAFCNWNLISLSKAEHNAMHYRDGHGLTRKGQELMERTARKFGIPPLSLEK